MRSELFSPMRPNFCVEVLKGVTLFRISGQSRFSWFLFLCAAVEPIFSQYSVPSSGSEPNPFPWPGGKRAAVSLTFDDARFSQIDLGIPLLDRYCVKATFFVSPYNVEQRLEGWRAASRAGHEIGNHTLTHPCTGNLPFSRNNALEEYTLEEMARNIDDATAEIERLLSVKPAAFAYPCGQDFVGRGASLQSYVPLVAVRFETGRKWLSEDSNDPGFCDMAQLMAVECDGKTFGQLLPIIQQTRDRGRWLILAGHETAGSGFQTTHLKTLEKVCRYCQDPKNGLWMDTVGNVSAYIRAQRSP